MEMLSEISEGSGFWRLWSFWMTVVLLLNLLFSFVSWVWRKSESDEARRKEGFYDGWHDAHERHTEFIDKLLEQLDERDEEVGMLNDNLVALRKDLMDAMARGDLYREKLRQYTKARDLHDKLTSSGDEGDYPEEDLN